MEIFLVTIGTAIRAPTFQINVAVTNFAPERIVSDKRRSAADKCIRIETYTGIADNCGIEGEKPSPQMTSKKKKKINGMENAAAGMGGERSYCKRRIVAPVLGRLRIAVRTEHLEVCRHSQPVSCLVFRAKKTNYWGKCLHNGRGKGREGWNSKVEGVTKANGQN